ncbi:secreted RxLR effector protein 161-like [Apium graveolens]|uniref:secreted RxLR effector protein 161-like n=1 Tax=Apium graveolens TaxID=4045 RepID=UPI003D7BE24C
MSGPTTLHWLAAKRILRYLKGTIDLGIFYKREEGNATLVAFTDIGYASDIDDRRSTFGYVFKIRNGVVSWSFKKQLVVSLSITEAGYIAAALCACHCTCLKRIQGEIGIVEDGATVISSDNSSFI